MDQQKTSVEYHRWAGPGSHLAMDCYGKKLNAFVGMSHDEKGNYEEMPYTEEAAEFFYQFLVGLCTLAEKTEVFFADRDRLNRAIENKISQFMLPSQMLAEPENTRD